MVKNRAITTSLSMNSTLTFDPISPISNSSHELSGGTIHKHTPSSIEDERCASPSNSESTSAGRSMKLSDGSDSGYATSNPSVGQQPSEETVILTDSQKARASWRTPGHKPCCNVLYKISDGFTLEKVDLMLELPLLLSNVTNERMTAFVPLQLSEFKEPKDMMEVVADAFEGHRRANVKFGYTHSAITDETVVINAHTGFGMLVDWDLAGNNVNSRLSRSGTCYFESIGLLKDPCRKVMLQDNLESFFYVTLYSALKFVRNNHCVCDTHLIIQAIFKNQTAGNCTMPGYTKRQMIRERGYIRPDFKFTKNAGLNRWHRGAAFEEYYTWLDRWQPVAAAIWKLEDKLPARPLKGTMLYDHSYLAALFDEAIATPDEVNSIALLAAASTRVVHPWEEAGWEKLTPAEKFDKVPSTEYRRQLWWEKVGLPLWKEIVLPELSALPIELSVEHEDDDREPYEPDDGEIEDDDPYVPYEPYIV
ncbi:unnamed protein product [Cyclocybe aegerita]|uniref:Fungal-type protein kinase domain-containing protein n=1 Tax=Cyclocybe aegerita TaxID=1973307 RepID=A0A8S0VTU5_CYCAE|nr:unnamed protein product [Cyclocybe aegerita]